jgi:hypothetical protein
MSRLCNNLQEGSEYTVQPGGVPKQLQPLYGSVFVPQPNEADQAKVVDKYTSKTSFLDNDVLPTFGAKPEGWKSSGIRTNRGLFKTATGIKINADCNGAANIIRKVAMMVKFDLAGISRGCLSQPKKVLLWTLQKSLSL